MKPVWIIDDDRSIRWVFEKTLTREDISFKMFSSAQDALTALGASVPQVVVSDIRMPGGSGLELLQKIKERHPTLPVIIMTAYSDLESAVAAFQGGAFEYLPKPFDVDHAVDLIRRAMDESLRQDDVAEVAEAGPEILGQAASMQEVFRAIGRLTQSHATVLINGESGTGKELVARDLHRHSTRAPKPFIAINTAAIPKDLLGRNCSGTSAAPSPALRPCAAGVSEQAERHAVSGRIGDMPPDLQTRLLRVLSDGHFYRVGGHQPIKANVRIIAATHQDLDQRVKSGLFREDLFHRLNVIRIRLPALRERREDIPLLAKYFLNKSAKDLNVEAKRMTDAAVKYLISHDFPGNVRQLENLCHWLTVMAPGVNIDIQDLPPEFREEQRALTTESWISALEKEAESSLNRGEQNIMHEMTRQFERALIMKALAHTGGRRIEASHLLGMGRNTLTRKIQELEIEGKEAAGEH
jgi:two-component system nitrogen regulation response regulator GlnG